MKRLLNILVLLAIVSGSFNLSFGQNPKKAARQAAIKNMVDSIRFYFNAEYALPQRGGMKNLTSIYDVKITKDSINAFLPYYGQAYMAPDPGTTEGGIKFISTNFSYKVNPGKKGGWEIIIKPKDHDISNWRDVQQMILNISPDGYATLSVISTNRDPISFQGNIIAKE
ncbi:DUF4251 domain-containing protein [Mucilaginibacter gotjawali]|uniref:Uncharacterized protein n=2 Tax=Mucilaginibacter gotjawali TaxID=1550579 RepID=A0A839S7W1_9SPHI|nr:DUF4251 domain-containing protein [Mucilaginibacter gotjawali]MBB3054211.1 hypothetical protein [Mucilaginibacter gotjawali]BAU54483.1 hypothetical protein MgSA37_02659 [Mucilaginibacter gotjawali]